MPDIQRLHIVLALAVGHLLVGVCAVCQAEAVRVSFVRDVAPILVQRCQGCHGAQQDESGYRVDTVERLLQPGDSSETVVQPGSLDDSLLWRLLDSQDESERMPKDGDRLPERELALIRGWIEQGAELDGVDRNIPLASQLLRAPYKAAPPVYPAPVPITAVAVTPLGDQIAVSGYCEVTVWDIHDGSLRSRIAPMAERTTQILWSPDRSIVAVTGCTPGVFGEVRLLNGHDWSEIRLLDTTTDIVLTAAFRPDGQQVAVGFPDQTIRIYDVASGAMRMKIESHADWVMSVAWRSDGKRIVSASRDRTSKVFEADTGDLVVTFSGHAVPVFGATFSPDGQLVYSCGADRRVLGWKVDNGEKVAEIAAHTDAVHHVLVDGDLLWTASADRSALVHRLDDRSVVQRFTDHPEGVTAIAVDAPHARVITGCFSGHVRVARPADGGTILEFLAAPGIRPAVSSR